MQLLNYHKCLADDIRLRCLLLITHECELCVSELMAALDEVQSKVSRHLAILKKSGLVLDRRVGVRVYYRLNPDIPNWAKHSLYSSYKENSQYIQPNLIKLANMQARPERIAASCQTSLR